MPTRAEGASWLKQQGVADPETALAQTGFAPLSALLSAGEAPARERKLMLAAVKQSAKFDALALAEQLQKAAPVQVISFCSNGAMTWPATKWRARSGTIRNKLI